VVPFVDLIFLIFHQHLVLFQKNSWVSAKKIAKQIITTRQLCGGISKKKPKKTMVQHH